MSRKMKLPGGHEFEMELLSPSVINIDMTYQRNLDQNRVNKIVKEWNPLRFRLPLISLRDGKYYIFDGQHTMAAWQTMYGNNPIPCILYHGLTWVEEAEAFVEQNNLRKSLTTNDKLRTFCNWVFVMLFE